MTAAFKVALPSTQKFVLVALCDSANDQGECYPSVTALMAKCSLSDRGVQKALVELVAAGLVRREFRTGRSTVYWISVGPTNSVHPRSKNTPEQYSPTPERGAPPPPNVAHPTPERGAPITINEPSIEPSEKQKSGAIALAFVRPNWIDGSTWDAYLDVRRAKRAGTKPSALQLIVKDLQVLMMSGFDPNTILETSIKRGWVGVFEPRPDVGTEGNYARQMREKYEQMSPLIAAKPPGAKRPNPMEILDDLTRSVDRPDLLEMQSGVRPGLLEPLGGD